MRGPHDVGGQPAGPVETQPHDVTFWEKQIDALHTLIGDDKRRITVRDENRRYVESLGDDVYNTLTYYERWTAATTDLMIEKGVVTVDELGRKMAEVEARWLAAGRKKQS